MLVENFRPGVIEKWGLGPQDLPPELVYVRISGYGQTGPKAPLPGKVCLPVVTLLLIAFAHLICCDVLTCMLCGSCQGYASVCEVCCACAQLLPTGSERACMLCACAPDSPELRMTACAGTAGVRRHPAFEWLR